ncbi:odorant receptor 13a-like [Mycetomoellerius zeteki]|uniref:odorant receptor 13a-like n=1 Tax=Mycetomoellerius zeteki TaxID=64791 RepID=UPI00084E67F1|nr:PREDICTED: odorant receptor 13a-like [Trachymyrmex zeteki]
MYGLIAILNEYKHVNITKDTMLEYPVPSKCFMKFLNAPVSMHKIFCLVEVIALILASTTNHGNDALFLNATLHICGQMKILRANFLDFDVKEPHIYDRFNVLIERHKYLIKLARELAEMISFVLLIELFIISILLCIMGFQLILQLGENNVVLITKNIMVQSTFITQLTLYSVIGDYLKSEMEEIGLSIYQSSWYNFPAKLTRHMIFIIMCSDSPVTLQAGNFIVVNLTTYVSILKSSLSYLSVLRVMKKCIDTVTSKPLEIRYRMGETRMEMEKIWKDVQTLSHRRLSGYGSSDFLEIEIVRADGVGALRERIGGAIETVNHRVEGIIRINRKSVAQRRRRWKFFENFHA